MPNKVELPSKNNIGLLRYILASGVIAGHYYVLSGRELSPLIQLSDLVGGFFAISGFLIYKSYKSRNSLAAYISHRARRILPQYMFVVIISALLLACFSSLAPAEYFTSTGFYKYLGANLTFLNFLHPTLPGVFTDNPITAVNGSLWTMKVEWLLYLSMPAAVWLTDRYRNRRFTILAAVYASAIFYRLTMEYIYSRTGNEIYRILARQVFYQMAYFYSGAAIYIAYDRFCRHKWSITSVAVILYVLSIFNYPMQLICRPAALAVILSTAGTTGRWGAWTGRNDNISYDMYLMHFPVIQVAVQLGWSESLGFMTTLALTAAITVALSCISWFGIGKPVLSR